MGPIGSPETSVSNHLTPHNKPEDGRIQNVIHTILIQCRYGTVHLKASRNRLAMRVHSFRKCRTPKGAFHTRTRSQ